MTSSIRVALVDDELELREALGLLLDSHGYRTRVYECPRTALCELTENPPDVLVTDLRMDALTGTELAQRLRSVHPRVGVVIVTGYASVDSAVEALRAGCADYLEKPVRGAQLVAAIERAAAAAPPETASSAGSCGTLRSRTTDPDFRLEHARFLAAELARMGLAGPYRRRVIAAVLEGLDNVQRHAYGPDGGACTVQVLEEGEPRIVVSDAGRGFEPAGEDGVLHPGPPRGLMRALVDVPGMRVTSHFGRGTRVTFPLEAAELARARRFAHASLEGTADPGDDDGLVDDPPWWTPWLARSERGSGSEWRATDQTARDVLWL